jgi:hypothetical protein
MWSGTSSATASGASSEIPWRIMRAAGDHQSPLVSGMCSIPEPRTFTYSGSSNFADPLRGEHVTDAEFRQE